MPIKHKLTVLLAALFLIAFGLAFFVQVTDYQFFVHAPFRKIEKGMTEAQVVRLLGPPEQTRTVTNPYDISYKLTGYTFRASKWFVG
jgi:outer membrane protein assembly factor BamE (lipoprotein component of BamABCDE complex)